MRWASGPLCVFKCDGEHSVEALREAVMARLGEGAVPQGPPAGESHSNGVVENGVKLLKGLVRVHVLALERKLGSASRPTTPSSPGSSRPLVTLRPST